MATFKIWVLRSNKKRDGAMPVTVQLTHNRQRRYIATPHVAFAPQLDRHGNIKDPNLKAITDGIYRSVKAIFDELSFRVCAYSADELKALVVRKLQLAGEDGSVDFFAFSDRYVDSIKGRQPGTSAGHRVMLGNMARYLGRRTININEITAHFLHKYQQWMAVQGSARGGPLGERGQSLYLSCIRTLFNAAQREYNDYDKGEVLIPNRPFERFKIAAARNLKTAEEKALSIAQIRAIRGYAPRGEKDALARDCFMLSFYLCGMNSVDLYRCEELLAGGVLRYYRAKVTGRRGDRAEMRVRLEPEAAPLLAKYAGRDGRRVFDFCERYASMGGFNSALNRQLKIVGKAVGIDDLEFYYARHSWATIACNDCGVPVDTVDDCLAHSDNRIAKKSYIKKDWEKVYRANRAVLDAVSS
ncbi:MAG: site-specific integrase [Prevotellaceae bacterium]|jgi:integrase|nr:site-specific integrase [Prevotellaceae bacterium]